MANTQVSIEDSIVAGAAVDELSGILLDWYDGAARDLPWRIPPGVCNAGQRIANPYHVWLSEIMLQQTSVTAVIPYFEKFLKAWPTIKALASADRDDVLAAWAGLGYYARARNLHKCAGIVAQDFAGQFPDTEEGLKSLPGVGPYTAAAIAAIAFDRAATVVDGNVERVISRLFAIEEALPKSKSQIGELAAQLTPQSRPGDYAQAIMDLGATVCRPKGPDCGNCPWADACEAHKREAPEEYPRRAKKKPRPLRTGTAYWLESDGHVYLRRRADKGLLGGMLEVPSTQWREGDRCDGGADCSVVLAEAEWRAMPGRVCHVFTHFELELAVMRAEAPSRPDNLEDGIWHPLSEISTAGLPSVMNKIAAHVLGLDEKDA